MEYRYERKNYCQKSKAPSGQLYMKQVLPGPRHVMFSCAITAQYHHVFKASMTFGVDLLAWNRLNTFLS